MFLVALVHGTLREGIQTTQVEIFLVSPSHGFLLESDEPHSRRKQGSHSAPAFFSQDFIELMFAQWHDRLYGNFREDEADDGLTSSDLISGSFFLPNVGGSQSAEWEALNMAHFLVYDGTSDLSAR